MGHYYTYSPVGGLTQPRSYSGIILQVPRRVFTSVRPLVGVERLLRFRELEVLGFRVLGFRVQGLRYSPLQTSIFDMHSPKRGPTKTSVLRKLVLCGQGQSSDTTKRTFFMESRSCLEALGKKLSSQKGLKP